MNINLPVKLHNRFDIEVKDTITGEIVQKGYAENIVLNNMFTSANFCSIAQTDYVGYSIQFGSGTGTLSSNRTTLFSRLGGKPKVPIELIINQPPLPSINTMKIVIEPSEYVGATLTEVGIGGGATTPTIYTHALIKDSEGNPLSLGPKTDTQEIIIYATVYLTLDCEEGIIYHMVTGGYNSLLFGAILHSYCYFRIPYSNYYPTIRVNNASEYAYTTYTLFEQIGNVFTSFKYTLATADANGKIKNIILTNPRTGNTNSSVFAVDLETLSQNNSIMWGGWEFDKTPVGIGDGITQVFTLPWGEVRLDKPKTVYVNGVADGSVIWTADSITFNPAPADGAVITADYWVDYIPKDTDHIVNIQFIITFGEGVPQ